jgi:hypothetical protein
MHNWGGSLPRAICTTYSGLEEGQYAALQSQKCRGCYVECYAADDQPGVVIHADLDRMINQGVAYRIPLDHLVPVCGTYRNELPNVYRGISIRGKQIGMYLAEPMAPATWEAWGKLQDISTPPPVALNPVDVNKQVAAEASRWLDQQSDLKPLSRLRIIRRISGNGMIPDDPKWVACREEIKKALDNAGIP